MHTENRIVYIDVDNTLLFAIMTKGFKATIETIEGLPEGATFVRSIYMPEAERTRFFFYHQSFQEIEGQEPPPLNVKITTHAY